MQQIYSFLILFYGLSIRIASVFNKKAALWVDGRRHYWPKLEKTISAAPFNIPGRKLAWFHCASLGEFEQGRTIIEALKLQHPEFVILLTFSSPSGYEIRKAYAGADKVMYLPLDTPSNVRRFVDQVKPTIAIFIKYEFWYNFLNYIQFKKIPLLLVSAIFRPEQHFFKFYGQWTRKTLQGFTRIFVQNTFSKELLKSINIENVEISGDTRFDRVAGIADKPVEIEIAKTFASNRQVLVAGSTWPADEELLIRLIQNNKSNLRYIIAPHEINISHINALLKKIDKQAVRFSVTNANEAMNAEVLLIDSIGMLSQLYQYGTLAYIGGGFGVGIHNILEAAAFGVPVIFGPNYQKFNEAEELIELKGAFEIKTAEELIVKTDELLSDTAKLSLASTACSNYVLKGRGSTGIIMKTINELLSSGI